MNDKHSFIAACGIPEIIVAACNSLEPNLPVKLIDDVQLEKVRPTTWLLSPIVFISHLDFFLPYRRQIVLWMAEDDKNINHASLPILYLSDSYDRYLEVLSKSGNNSTPFDSEKVTAPLSNREKDVLRLIASGLTAKEIGDALGISANTVVTHRKNLSTKLGIRCASGLSLYALMNGLI